MRDSEKTLLILHSSSDLYGASKILLTTIRIFKNKGFKIQVVLSDEGLLSDAIRAEGIQVHIIRLGILRRKYFNVKGLINRIGLLNNAYNKLIHLANKEKFTHIYSNTTAVLVGAFVARRVNAYHIWHVHEIITHPKWFSKLMGMIVNRLSDQVIVVSEAVKGYWQPYISNEKINVIRNGIDYSTFLTPSKDFRIRNGIKPDVLLIGMVGRISAWKGQFYFLDLAEIIKKDNSKVHFLMVGDAFSGDEVIMDEIREKIKHLNLEENITVLGFQENVAAIYNAMDIFILPSIKPDPLPTVVLEAMASAKPVVATAHGGASEMVVDGKTGVLIPWDNAMEAYEIIKPIINNPTLRQQYSLEGRSRVLKEFSIELFEARMTKIFN